MRVCLDLFTDLVSVFNWCTKSFTGNKNKQKNKNTNQKKKKQQQQQQQQQQKHSKQIGMFYSF